MATIKTASRDDGFSQDDLLLLAKSLKDEKFRGLLGEFAKEISDPNKQKQYENEVKKWEKQKGVDVVFLHPTPGFVVVVSVEGRGDGSSGGVVDPVCVNICTSDVIQEPSFVRSTQGTSLGHSWSIPHAVTKPRKEFVAGEKQLLRELYRGRGSKKGPGSKQLKEVVVCDVVFHPDTLHLAGSNHAMKQSVIQSAMDSLSQNYQIKALNPPKEINCVNYVGKPMKSVIKKVVNKKLHEESEKKLNFLNKGEDERTTSFETEKPLNKVDNQSTNVLKEESKDSKCVTPEFSIKHVSKVDLQDFAIQLIPQSSGTPAWRPLVLEVEVQLPGVSRASQVDAEVWHQSITLTTNSTPQYKLELPLPYPVDEDLSTAKFDVSTQKLTFLLTVIPASKKDQMPLPSPSSSSDSGIDCEPGYRTNSDGDNSSEVSVSSQEDGGQRDEEADDDDDESNVFESAPSSPVVKAFLIPSYSLKQTEDKLSVILHCGSILPSSVSVSLNGKQRVCVSLSSIGGGQTQLNYGMTLVTSPHSIEEFGVSHQINADNMEVTIKKANPGHWETCQVGNDGCLATVTLEKMVEESPVIALHTKDELTKSADEENAAPHQKNGTDATASMARKPRVVRAVSMCETSDSIHGGVRLKGPTCSWPRGILKRRSRSLSESQLGSILPLESMVSLESSFDLEVLEDKDGEESVEENLACSFGEKKSVRFNDVVSRQLFRSNSSILGQRAKNQKKAMKKQKCRDRRASESDRDSDASQCHSDPGPSSGDLSATTTTTTTTEEEDTDVIPQVEENLNNTVNKVTPVAFNSAFTYVDLDVKNNNSVVDNQNIATHNDNGNGNNNNNANNNNNNDEDLDNGEGFMVKTSKKKRKSNKKNKKFEPSNNFIFQLDIEQ